MGGSIAICRHVVLAREAIDKPSLSSHLFWIVEEYQDFNAAEDHLIRSLTAVATGVTWQGWEPVRKAMPSCWCSRRRGPRIGPTG